MVTMWSGGFLKDRTNRKASIMAVPNPSFLGLTNKTTLSYSFWIFFTILTVPSGLESSMTVIKRLSFNSLRSWIKFSMFSASQYVGSTTATVCPLWAFVVIIRSTRLFPTKSSSTNILSTGVGLFKLFHILPLILTTPFMLHSSVLQMGTFIAIA